MASQHITYTNKHDHPSFKKLTDPLHKWVLDILVCNEFTSRSGIYRIGSGFLADKIACKMKNETGEPLKDVFGTEKLTDADEAKKILKILMDEKVIEYEPISHIVYIKNFLEMVPFGLAAGIISTAICKEYKNFFIEEYWKDFFWNYGKQTLDYISSSEANSEKTAKKAMKKNNRLSKDDFTILSEDMKILRGLIETYGYDKDRTYKIILPDPKG